MRAVSSNQDIPQYFNCIDAIRVLAALAVVIFHYHHFYLSDFTARPDIPPIETFPYGRWLGPIYLHGDKAVELFWIISGFVFMHVYLPAATTLGRFALARFARLYPLHFTTLLIVLGLQSISLEYAGHWQIYGNNTLRYFIPQLFLASNWTTWVSGLSFNGPIWSVSLEIGAYLAFFLALSMLRQLGVWAALAIAALFWALSQLPHGTMPVINTGVLTCAGYFFTGVSLYFLFKGAAPRRYARIGLVLILFLTGACSFALGLQVLGELAFGCTLICLAGLCDLRLGEAGQSLKSVGNISYSLYLMHVPLQMGVLLCADIFFEQTRDFAAYPATLPIYLAASLALSAAAFVWLERPAGRHIRRFVAK